jgi:hypothetical protein
MRFLPAPSVLDPLLLGRRQFFGSAVIDSHAITSVRGFSKLQKIPVRKKERDRSALDRPSAWAERFRQSPGIRSGRSQSRAGCWFLFHSFSEHKPGTTPPASSPNQQSPGLQQAEGTRHRFPDGWRLLHTVGVQDVFAESNLHS